MFCSVTSAAIVGVEASLVAVEADISSGLPGCTIVGLSGTQAREVQERVRTSLKNLGFSMPAKRITINLSPGEIKKEGARFDLPIAGAILLAMEKVPPRSLEGILVLGELHLDGRVGPVNGILPSVLCARAAGITTCLIPKENLQEGRVVDGIQVMGVGSLYELVEWCRGKQRLEETDPDLKSTEEEEKLLDFSQVLGQGVAKRAAMIAAAGFHNLLLSGPPGSGKSMIAARMAGILPDMTPAEQLEVSRIYSVAGLLSQERPLMKMRPFRAPHYTISPYALCGGGTVPRPGEITLAHKGVLYLDEIPEIAGRTLELLRQPLEDHSILLSRLGGIYRFPAEFLLVAAMNPCPCGYFPNRDRCNCTPKEIQAYQRRISQALLDRIDLQVTVQAAEYKTLQKSGQQELGTADMRHKVNQAVEVQKERYKGTDLLFNSQLSSGDLERYCTTTPEGERLLEAAFRSFGLSARGYHRILKTSRTIADLEGSEHIHTDHISEALGFRNLQERMVLS